MLTTGDRVVRPSHLIFKKKVYSPDTLLSYGSDSLRKEDAFFKKHYIHQNGEGVSFWGGVENYPYGIELVYDINPELINQFELNLGGLFLNDQLVTIPDFIFTKMKQKYSGGGP